MSSAGAADNGFPTQPPRLPCPESGAALLVSKHSPALLCTSGFALRLEPTGRLGNALIGAANVLAVAKATASKALFPIRKSALDVLLGPKASNATFPAIIHDFSVADLAARDCGRVVVADRCACVVSHNLSAVEISAAAGVKRCDLDHLWRLPELSFSQCTPTVSCSWASAVSKHDADMGTACNPTCHGSEVRVSLGANL